MINGVKYAWEGITVNATHGEMVDIKDISYDESKEKEPLYGKGPMPVGVGYKNVSSTGKMTIRREEILKWEKQAGKALANLEPFPITVSYAAEGQNTTTDVLRQCAITTKTGMGAAQGDPEVTVDLDFLILGGIKYDGIAIDD